MPSVSYIFRQLCTHGLIEPLPEQSAVYEPTMRIQRLLREFQREQVLSTPKVLRGHLEQIETDRERLRTFGETGSQSGAIRTLERLGDEMEEIRRISRHNREAILNHVAALRAQTKGISVKDRFDVVNEMMDDHIHPLKELASTSGMAEDQFSQLDTVLGHVQKAFAHAPAVLRELLVTQARLRRVRRRVFQNFESARDEVLPLFNEQKHSTRLVRGASQLLQAVHRAGPDVLRLPERLRLLRINIRTVFDDDAMRSFLLDMRAYTPAPPDPISDHAADAPPVALPRRAELIAQIVQACPIDDVMARLVDQFADADTSHVLAAYRYVLQSNELHVSFDATPCTYPHGLYLLEAPPARVEAAELTAV
ncbi:MAG: hypothetical protein PPP56_01925 [Longimonas sp.]|uniref:hypothetical protein n=1 Tax=Longimonas sp. TaxID=2039626 RepID=UPI003352F0AB